jgi:Tol biopolymer transport system component
MTALTTGGKINGEDINGQVAISPDGKYVVCAANDAKQQASLWLRQVSTNSLVRIVPPENGGYLATTFSPDGELIYYVATWKKQVRTNALSRSRAGRHSYKSSRSGLQCGCLFSRRQAVRFCAQGIRKTWR